VNVALLQALHARSSSELSAELLEGLDAATATADGVAQLIRDRDKFALERLEALAAHFHGLARLTNNARDTFAREMREAA
jgi:hypothetical protein